MAISTCFGPLDLLDGSCGVEHTAYVMAQIEHLVSKAPGHVQFALWLQLVQECMVEQTRLKSDKKEKDNQERTMVLPSPKHTEHSDNDPKA